MRQGPGPAIAVIKRPIISMTATSMGTAAIAGLISPPQTGVAGAITGVLGASFVFLVLRMLARERRWVFGVATGAAFIALTMSVTHWYFPTLLRLSFAYETPSLETVVLISGDPTPCAADIAGKLNRGADKRVISEYAAKCGDIWTRASVAANVSHLRVLHGFFSGNLVFFGLSLLFWAPLRKRRRSDSPDYVRLEIELAIQHQVPILPVLVDAAPPPAASDLPTSISSIARLNAFHLRHGRDWARDVLELQYAIRRVGGERATVFISYRRRPETQHAAGRLCDSLNAELPNEIIFLDVDAIVSGADFLEVISQRIATARALIVLIGPAWARTFERD